jgi:uncharacterized protein YceK
VRPSPSRVIVLVAAAAALLLAGCSSTVTGSAAPTGGSPSAPGGIAEAEQQAEDLVEGGAPQETLDACALLPAAEVEALVGPGTTGTPSDGVASNVCEWENQDTYYSVTLEIGQPGSAAGGQLPPWEPIAGEERSLGDGMREGPGGGVEFVAGDRDCFVLVVTEDLGGSADEATAVEIAQQVRGEL